MNFRVDTRNTVISTDKSTFSESSHNQCSIDIFFVQIKMLGFLGNHHTQ
jgi:hypothetical protein